jgi:fatty-acyl-CoA synthase
MRGARPDLVVESDGVICARVHQFDIEGMTIRSPIAQADKSARSSSKADWLRALQRTAKVDIGSRRTLAAIIEELARKHPDRPALVGDVVALTFGELAALSRRYSRWAINCGLRSGDHVGLMMNNQPDYVAIWIGLSRIGIVVALVNSRLVGASLVHCVKVAAAQHIIVDSANYDSLRKALGPSLSHCVSVHGAEHGQLERIDVAIDRFSDSPLETGEGERPFLSELAMLVFTSGTTGAPKAARVSHYRIVMWSEWFAGILDVQDDDRLYNCLPLCHSVGGVVGVGSALVAGASVIVRRDFSATRFWADIIASRATIFLYIGELCRYLLASAGERGAARHQLRLCFGNGLNPVIWGPFAKSFAIPRIIEFYASTEGSFSLFNLEGKPGAIGWIPPFLAHRLPVALVRMDPDTEKPLRGADGFCFRCATNEIGEALGMIDDRPSQLATRFEGYSDAEATELKVLRDVFVKGDAWFRTGDLMRIDSSGFYYFVDRIGDTFRWKGENVSNSQVEVILRAAPGVLDAAVYAVKAPLADGRAGMAALAVAPDFDFATLRRHINSHLPSFARPLFLRLCDKVALTQTFKPTKADYRRDGFNPSVTGDRLFFDDVRLEAYRPLDKELYDEICFSGGPRRASRLSS